MPAWLFKFVAIGRAAGIVSAWDLGRRRRTWSPRLNVSTLVHGVDQRLGRDDHKWDLSRRVSQVAFDCCQRRFKSGTDFLVSAIQNLKTTSPDTPAVFSKFLRRRHPERFLRGVDASTGSLHSDRHDVRMVQQAVQQRRSPRCILRKRRTHRPNCEHLSEIIGRFPMELMIRLLLRNSNLMSTVLQK